MLRFAKTPPKTPPARATKYVPLEPMKPKTQKQVDEEELANLAADGLFAAGKGGLRDSRWASPQYFRRVQPAVVNVSVKQGANKFFHNAAKTGIKIGSSPALEVKVEAVSALNTPPDTPPSSAIDPVTIVLPQQLPAPAPVKVEVEVEVAVPVPVAPSQTAVSAENKIAPPLNVVASQSQQAQAPTTFGPPPPHPQQRQLSFNSVQPQAHSLAPPPLPSQAVVIPQPPQFLQSGYVPPHLRHLQPGFKSVQPQGQTAASPQGQTTAVVSPADSTAPRGIVTTEQGQSQASVPSHPQRHKSASPSPPSQSQVAGPSQAQYLPPHLRRPVQVATPAASKPAQPQSVVPTQAVPPHLRRPVQVSLPQMVIHHTAPQLRGISSNQTSSQLPTTQVSNTTTPSQIVGTAMAPSFCPPPRSTNDGQDDFLKWLSNRKSTKKVEVAEQVTIKSEGPFNPVQPPQALPVRSPQVSPSKESTNSKWSQESVKNINNTDDFLKYMEKANPKAYGIPPKISKSPKQASPSNGWQRPKNAFDNPHWKLNDDSVANFESYIKNGATPTLVAPAIQDNSVYGTANVRAAKAQAAQVVAPKVQYSYQKPTFVGAQKLGQNAPQTKQIVQNVPAQSIEKQKPAAQAPVTIETVASNLNDVAPHKLVTQTNAAPLNAAEWQGMPNMQSVAAMISSDINKVQPQTSSNIPPLTNEALVLTTGFKTVHQNNYSDDRISSTGLGNSSSDHAQDPRHTQGNDMVDQFFDWDGSRVPAPIWEEERPSFDDSFIPEYIKEWQKTLPSGKFKVDINDDKFASGVYPINNVFFIDPIDQGPDTIPDVAENTNDQEMKRRFQTAEIEANNYSVAVEKKQLQMKRQAKASNARYRQIAAKQDEPNPFSPAIDMYMRPAEEKDAANIVDIYNWYISNSATPEDQEPISEEDGKWLIKQAKDDKLPFLVAIKGRQPTDVDAQGRSSPNIMLPACEQVIGFCFPERFNYGFSGKVARSRATVNLQLYVHNECTRKGIGRNLLDRLIHCLNPGYAYKNAAAWINPSNNKLYETEGAGLFHQLLFQVPVEHKNDPNIAWLTKFLLKFLFKENVFREGGKEHPKRLTSVCRSTTKGRMAHFLDLAIFHYEARQEGEFDPYM